MFRTLCSYSSTAAPDRTHYWRALAATSEVTGRAQPTLGEHRQAHRRRGGFDGTSLKRRSAAGGDGIGGEAIDVSEAVLVLRASRAFASRTRSWARPHLRTWGTPDSVGRQGWLQRHELRVRQAMAARSPAHRAPSVASRDPGRGFGCHSRALAMENRSAHARRSSCSVVRVRGGIAAR